MGFLHGMLGVGNGSSIERALVVVVEIEVIEVCDLCARLRSVVWYVDSGSRRSRGDGAGSGEDEGGENEGQQQNQ